MLKTDSPDPAKDKDPADQPEKAAASASKTPTPESPRAGRPLGPEALVFPESAELSTAAVISLALAVTLLLITAGLFVWRISISRSLSSANERVAAARTELSKPDMAKLDSQAAEITAGLTLLSQNLSVKSSASLFLKKLQGTTHKDVRLTNLSLDGNNVMKLDGEAKTYQAVAKQLAALKASGTFTDVLLVTASQTQELTGSAVAFSLQAQLIPSKLSAATK